MINILGRDIPNALDELNIEQFETITEINNNQELDPIDKHLKIFEYLGIPEREFWDYDVADFIDIVKQFNNIKQVEYPTIDILEIDGYTYKAEMKLTVRDTKMIEKIALKRDKGYVSEMLAVMFKREDLSNTEHYTDAHIKHKAKLFKQLSADISVPYLIFITNKINKQVEAQATKELEPSNSGSVPGIQQD
jgi:hypothetical protein